MLVTRSKWDEIAAIRAEIDAVLSSWNTALIVNLEAPIFVLDSERLDLMKSATLLAYLSEIDVACYPLSVSAVYFIP